MQKSKSYFNVSNKLISVLEDAVRSKTRIRYWIDQTDIRNMYSFGDDKALMGVPEIRMDSHQNPRFVIKKKINSKHYYPIDLSRIYKVSIDCQVVYLKDGYDEPDINISEERPFGTASGPIYYKIIIDGEDYYQVYDNEKDAKRQKSFLVGESNLMINNSAYKNYRVMTYYS